MGAVVRRHAPLVFGAGRAVVGVLEVDVSLRPWPTREVGQAAQQVGLNRSKTGSCCLTCGHCAMRVCLAEAGWPACSCRSDTWSCGSCCS